MSSKTIRFLECLLAGLVLFLLSWRLTGCDLKLFLSRAGHLTDLTGPMLRPDLPFLSQILSPMLLTIRMSVTGTIAGAFLALFAAPLCAANLDGNPYIRAVLRASIQILRSFPPLILALTATFLLGLGSFAGTCALTIYTFSIMGRLTYEDAEAAPLGAYKALIHMGCGKASAYFRAVFPHIMPAFLTNMLYLMETNVRYSSIMGYVGAGGIGLLLSENISWRDYSRVGTILLALFAAVCIMEAVSEFLVGVVKKERSLPASVQKSLVMLLAAIAAACFAFQEGPDLAHTSAGIALNMAKGLIHPDTEFLFSLKDVGLLRLLAETVCISFAGTVLGTVPALLLAFFNTDRFMPKPIAAFFRIFTMLIRSVPFLIYGLIFIRVTGSGAFAGVLTIAVCSIGLLTKRFTEGLEALDLRSYRALCSSGSAPVSAFCRAVLPQLLPVIGSQILYRFDVNIREASILGFVGAGGIGATLILAMNKYAWPTAGTVFWGLVALVLVIDRISGSLRKRLYT